MITLGNRSCLRLFGMLVRSAEPQPMVGILNSALARIPVGQREVTAFCLV
jgi:hypothetical protein